MRPIALALTALAAALAPTHALATGFNFALEEVRISGNAVFFDDFSDGLRNGPPTSGFVDQGASFIPEANGTLVFTDSDGSRVIPGPTGTTLQDNAALGSVPILDSAIGTTVVEATWDARLPVNDGFGQHQYGIALDDPSANDIETIRFRLAHRTAGGGVPVVQLFVADRTTFYGQQLLPIADLLAASTVTFIMTIDHASKTVTPGYRLDNGPIVDASAWQTPTGAIPIFVTDTETRLQVAGRGFIPAPEPGTASLLVAGLLAWRQASARARASDGRA